MTFIAAHRRWQRAQLAPLLWLPPLFATAWAIATLPLFWATAGLLAVAATLLVLINPWLLWLALAALLPITSAARIGPAAPTDLLLAGVLGCWFLAAAARRSVRLAPQLPFWPVLLYVTVLIAATLDAPQLDEALVEVVKWVEFALIILLVPVALPKAGATWLVTALLVAAAGQGIQGLYQFIYRIGPDWFAIGDRFMRASGLFGQPNPYGGYLGLSLPVAVSLSLWGISNLWQRPQAWKVWAWTAFYLATTVAIGAGLIASWSRGGWLGAAAALSVVLALFSRQTALLLGIGALVGLAAALAGALNPGWIPPAILARVADLPAYFGLGDVLNQPVNDANFAVIERLAHWLAALRMWEAQPWLGVGPGNYAAAYADYALPRWPDPLGHAHNIYLNVLGETGILGLLTFLFMWGTLVSWLLRSIWRRPGNHTRQTYDPSWSRALGVGILGILTHLAVHSVFDNLFVQGMYLHLALWLAAFAAITPMINRKEIFRAIPAVTAINYQESEV